MAGVLGGAFFLGVCWILVMNLYSKWKTSRRVNSPILNDAHEDFLEGNHGPVVEHHIWYINTVGLQQSVIDSIMVCKFKKDEGLIEGTECSVCLSEFQEDESLRLLPKCSHAFHLPCIDTWLRSHKNCPLCRAPIVRESVSGVVNSAEGNSDDSGSREDTQVENLENHGGLGSHQVGDSGTTDQVRSRTEDLDASPIEIGRISDILKSSPYFDGTNCEFRVLSDLANNRRVPEQELQPVRRSVSLDSSSASVIYRAMANVAEHEGSSGSQLVQVKNPNSGSFAKRDSSGSSSIFKLMKSSSIGRSLQKKPISMRRSFSSSGKLSLPKHSRSQTSILPM